MDQTSEFAQHYRGLSEEALVHIAAAGELVPEAQRALAEEFARRKIPNLASRIETVVKDRKTEAKKYEENIINEIARIRVRRNITCIGLALVFGAAALRGIIVKNEDDLAVAIVLGSLFIVGIWLWLKFREILLFRVLKKLPRAY